MRAIDERAIKAHADLRFRSEYDYALFEYYRSAKVIAFLERAGEPEEISGDGVHAKSKVRWLSREPGVLGFRK